ncbi:DUF6339 family protein [Streptomyces sp. NPDC002812]|uniref:DUF6339 family protein n=1 Tax=Streptomyces sp. NPDC002812 TaxID=3154434 RepID=UPI003332093E
MSTSTTPNRIPDNRLGRLSDIAAAKVLSRAVVEEGAAIPQARLREQVEYWFPDERRWSSTELTALLEHATDRFAGERATAMDAWLAPRLHSTLRLTRAEATDNQLWNHLGLQVGPALVRARWGKPNGNERLKVGQAARFSGRWDIQCFSRLWWMAELFRDGDDYSPVVSAAGNQDVINTALRQDMMNHRPAAQALIRLAEKGVVRTGRDINGLVKAARLAGSTVIYEVIAPDAPTDRDHDALRAWIQSKTDTYWELEKLAPGPLDGRVDEASVQRLAQWFEELFRTAPVRGKELDDEVSATS